jgi:hypothetical protein
MIFQGGPGLAQDARLPAPLDLVLKTYEARESRRNPIHVKLKRHIRELMMQPQPNGAPAVTTLKRYDDEGEVVIKNNMKRTWSGNAAPDRPQSYQESFHVFNGTTEVSHFGDSNRFLLRRSPSGLNDAEPPWSMSGEERLLAYLRSWEKKTSDLKLVSTSMTRGFGDEEVCLIVFDYPNASGREKAWLLPGKEWIPWKLEIYDGKGNLTSIWETFEFMARDDLPFPKRGRRQVYNQKEIINDTQYEVTSLELDAGNIPDDLFAVKFPKDAEFWDEDENVLIRNPEVAQSHLQSIIANAGQRTSWGQVYAIVGGAGLVLIAALALSLAFWRRRRRTHRCT